MSSAIHPKISPRSREGLEDAPKKDLADAPGQRPLCPILLPGCIECNMAGARLVFFFFLVFQSYIVLVWKEIPIYGLEVFANSLKERLMLSSFETWRGSTIRPPSTDSSMGSVLF